MYRRATLLVVGLFVSPSGAFAIQQPVAIEDIREDLVALQELLHEVATGYLDAEKDPVHRMLAVGRDPDSVAILVRELVSSGTHEANPDAGGSAHVSEHYVGEFLYALNNVVGLDDELASSEGVSTLNELVDQEMLSSKYYESVQYIHEQAPADLRKVADAAPSGIPDEEDWRAYVRQVREIQSKFLPLDLSRTVAVLARQLNARGLPVDHVWTDATGNELTLLDLMGAQHALYLLDEEVIDVEVLVDGGVHVLEGLATAVYWLRDDPSFDRYRGFYEEEIGRISNAILNRPIRRRLVISRTDLLVDLHFLAYMFSSTTYKPERLRPENIDLEREELTEEEARIVTIVEDLANHIKVRRTLGPAFSAHGYHALKLTSQRLWPGL